MTTRNVLDEIIAHKLEELEAHKLAVPLAELKARAQGRPAALDFVAALRPAAGQDGRVRLIAEIKRASPSRGALNASLDPRALAVDYAANGAAAISVLTDSRYFRGDIEDLVQARAALTGDPPARLSAPVPLLRKDFIFDPYQLYASHAYGADAVLLIAAALPGDLLAALLTMAHALGMSALVEVHSEAELEQALLARPRVIGINNRDLRNLSVDLATFERLRPLVPPGVIVVAESGVHSAADVQRLADQGADAVLVGEALVTARNVGAQVREFASVPRGGPPT